MCRSANCRHVCDTATQSDSGLELPCIGTTGTWGFLLPNRSTSMPSVRFQSPLSQLLIASKILTNRYNT